MLYGLYIKGAPDKYGRIAMPQALVINPNRYFELLKEKRGYNLEYIKDVEMEFKFKDKDEVFIFRLLHVGYMSMNWDTYTEIEL